MIVSDATGSWGKSLKLNRKDPTETFPKFYLSTYLSISISSVMNKDKVLKLSLQQTLPQPILEDNVMQYVTRTFSIPIFHNR